MVVAHRGASHVAPENTMAAFQLAWLENADAIEGDFYLTADGQIVCFHDKTTKRLCPSTPALTVAEATLAELQKLDVGTWKSKAYEDERMPTLTDVLANVPKGKKFFLEVKSGVEIMPALINTLAQTDLEDEQIVIIAFDAQVIAACRQEMPQYKASWLTGFKQKGILRKWQPQLNSILQTLKESGATGLGVQGNRKVVDESFADAIEAAGVELHVWTVDDPADAQYFKNLGVQSITTNKPESIRQTLTP
jgi:glycerophosphoryl diester phosphodiesterase